jgi:branched-chain amino acid transport system ATP-binding protein
MAELVLQGVSAGYRGMVVLHDISFTVCPGEAVGITGANGAGKTTLMNVIAGALPALTGTICYHGRRLERTRAERRVRCGVALVPEGRQVIRELTVQGNLDITLLSRGRITRDHEHANRLDSVYELFPALRDRRRVRAGELSGGEQQMLAIGRAMMCRPSLLLLDEPSLGLAANLVDQLIETLAAMRGQLTMIIAEHSPAVLDGLTSRRLEVRMGRMNGPRTEEM